MLLCFSSVPFVTFRHLHIFTALALALRSQPIFLPIQSCAATKLADWTSLIQKRSINIIEDHSMSGNTIQYQAISSISSISWCIFPHHLSSQSGSQNGSPPSWRLKAFPPFIETASPRVPTVHLPLHPIQSRGMTNGMS